MSDDTLQGRFVWYELLTSDPDAATGFYTELIGVKVRGESGAAGPAEAPGPDCGRETMPSAFPTILLWDITPSLLSLKGETSFWKE